MTFMFPVKLCTIDLLGNLHDETEQLLSHAEEKELVQWITRLTITGYPPEYETLREMAEEVRNRVLCRRKYYSSAVIFRAEHLSRQWIPASIHGNWRFSCTSNC